MDVAPISKTSISIPDVKSEENAPERISGRTEDKDVPVRQPVFEQKTEIEDPVRRAEQAIGPFFEDANNPIGRFSIDQDIDSGRFVYRLVNTDTGEVIKQFPGDYVLRRVAYYRELEGLAVDSRV
ncbi:MAG: flagellar protein FlaG [Sneathiella sp.]|nr:flagellar protein FlaG [Sneathiella sp.]